MADSSALLTSPLSSSKSRVPGKRCIVKRYDKTNADHVSLFQFPDKVKHRSVFDPWVKFVRVTRDPRSWSRGAGYVYVCNDHFTPEIDYENFTQLQYGNQTIPTLNKEKTVPSKRPSPTPGQLQEDSKKFAAAKSKGQPRSYVNKPSTIKRKTTTNPYEKPTILDLVVSSMHGLSSEVFLYQVLYNSAVMV